ncbi:MAG: DUF1194 domain-containing protein, partial [Ruegeria sp.]
MLRAKLVLVLFYARRRHPIRQLAKFALICGLLGPPVEAGEESYGSEHCSLALAFALDISVSVNEAEYKLQRDGLASALLDPTVTDAILTQPNSVVMMAYEWSGSHQQQVIVPWSRIVTKMDLLEFTASLTDHAWQTPEYPTAIGRAIGFG